MNLNLYNRARKARLLLRSTPLIYNNRLRGIRFLNGMATVTASAASAAVGLGLARSGIFALFPLSVIIFGLFHMGIVPFGGGGGGDVPNSLNLVITLKEVLEDLNVSWGLLSIREEDLGLYSVHQALSAPILQNTHLLPTEQARDTLKFLLETHAQSSTRELVEPTIKLSVDSIKKVIYVIDTNICLLELQHQEFTVKHSELLDSYNNFIILLKNFAENIQAVLVSLNLDNNAEGLKDAISTLAKSREVLNEIVCKLDSSFTTNYLEKDKLLDLVADKLDAGWGKNNNSWSGTPGRPF